MTWMKVRGLILSQTHFSGPLALYWILSYRRLFPSRDLW